LINRRLINLFKKHPLLIKGAAFFGAYISWLVIFRLLVLSFITYFVVSSSHSGHAGRPFQYEDINEAFSASEPGIMALGALLFVLLIPLLNPLTRTSLRDIFNPERLEKRFVPGFAQGAVFASGVVLAFLISGIYRYLGFFIHFEDTSFAIGNVFLRIASLGTLAYCEEFIFRQRLLTYFKLSFEKAFKRRTAAGLISAVLVSLLFCLAKAFQFDLGWTQLITLFLVSVSLSLRFLEESPTGDFGVGAGFWAALLIVFHPLLSLPVFGSEFSGLVLVKLQAATKDGGDSSASLLFRLLTGGQSGPLSSFALQLLFAFDIARSIIKYQRAQGSVR
jgi:hypothetical protein